MDLLSYVGMQRKQHNIDAVDLCRRRLMGYAESFEDLARTLDGELNLQGQDRQTILEQRRVWENKRAVREGLCQMSQIMSHVAREELQYRPMEPRKQKNLVRAMGAEGILAEDIYYLPREGESKALAVTLSTTKKREIPGEEVADMLSVLLKVQMQNAGMNPRFLEREKQVFVFEECPKHIVLTGFSKAVRENEVMSGDNYAILDSERGKLMVILSDGTGSGEQAGRDSEKILDLLEKMLESGYDTRSALQLVNSALYVGEEDGNHPTVDLCTLDLYKGGYCFCKVGGSPSFLKRGHRVESIGRGSLPLGVFQNLQPETAEGSMESGSFLFFMTDGVVDAFAQGGGEEELMDCIGKLREENPGELAEKLMQCAIRSAGGRILDDMTILVAGMWENSSIT